MKKMWYCFYKILRHKKFAYYLQHHPWCSMPCIECAAMDKYLFSDGVIRCVCILSWHVYRRICNQNRVLSAIILFNLTFSFLLKIRFLFYSLLPIPSFPLISTPDSLLPLSLLSRVLCSVPWLTGSSVCLSASLKPPSLPPSLLYLSESPGPPRGSEWYTEITWILQV
jgi:hypothetical protein